MDTAHGKDFVLTDYAKNLIKFKARQLSRRQSFRPSDLDDLKQELWLTVTKKCEQFDPTKASLDTFIDRVVDTAAAMILRNRRRLKRAKGFQTRSLDGDASTARQKAEPLSATISEDDLARRIGAEHRDETARCEGVQAVHDALALMPDKLRNVCRRLMGGTISSVARDLGTSRRQVRKAIAAARPFFERAGFGKS
jgi:RNA polymerase sigma-70 factor (ECF subfamily)